ncbi:MAG TPA: DNA polymerase III subunit [Pirellulaceae bacterium]|jgi:DNA polymerase-3 subunit delta'|nr:DNA polymerase III subunit [Pirellulaceae bacterium]
MSWLGIRGQDEVVDRFRTSLRRGRLGQAYLFVGPEGSGKRAFARALAMTLFCPRSKPEAMSPCGECPSCQQAKAETHPDLIVVRKPKDKSSLPVDLLIGPKENRLREGFCYDLSFRPVVAKRRVGVIEDADALNEEGANCLLKTLEEPPRHATILLLAENEQRQLPTIRSRCQIVRFRELTAAEKAASLVDQHLAATQEEALQMVRATEIFGSADAAEDDRWKEFREEYLGLLADLRDWRTLGESVRRFTDGISKEASERREALRRVGDWTVAFFRGRIRQRVGGAFEPADDELQSTIERSMQRRPLDEEFDSTVLESTLRLLQDIDRNANLGTLIDAWVDEIRECDLGAAR